MRKEFRKAKKKELVELLSKKFVECIIGLNNGTWEPRCETRSFVNFLYFQDGKNLDEKFGTQGFIRSIALEENIFLDEGNGDLFSSDRRRYEFNKFNIDGNLQPLQFSEITNPARMVAEKLLEENAKFLPDSITIISTSSDGKRIFKDGEEINDWGDGTPETKTSPNIIETPKETKRRKVIQEVLLRPEQAKFRKRLLKKYNGTCIITKCATKQALEAAHIIPVSKKGTDSLENGLLLRADMHLLFDAGLMSINPKTKEVHFKKSTDGYYDEYTKADIPHNPTLRENLAVHWEKFNEQIKINTTIVSRETLDKESK